MPTKRLPASPDIDHLKHQAKDLLRDFRARQMAAFQRVREFHPKHGDATDVQMPGRAFSLSDAQLSIAREYGYASWPRLKAAIAGQNHQELELSHNDRLPDGPFKQALDFIDEGDETRLRAHLAQHPALVHERAQFEGGNYFQTPTLLEFVPENPNRQGRLPINAVAIAQILLAAGAQQNQAALNETVMLAASGRLCREAGLQTPLINLLCQHGADPASAMHSALAHSEFDAARALIANGAPLDLPAAAALDERAAVQDQAAAASTDELQLALALAATTGRSEVVQMLLAAGADPNRYNPTGGHSHCTPLHSAVAANELGTAKALIEGGADQTIPDIHHKMTALGWADYLKHEEILDYLKSCE